MTSPDVYRPADPRPSDRGKIAWRRLFEYLGNPASITGSEPVMPLNPLVLIGLAGEAPCKNECGFTTVLSAISYRGDVMLRKRLLVLIGMLLAQLTCAYASAGDVLAPEDAAAIRQFFESRTHRTGSIDLSVPNNEKAYYAMLRLSGFTPATKPKLFEQLQAVKRKQIALHAAGKAVKIDGCGQALAGQLRHVYEIIGIAANSDFTSVNVKTLDSIYHGADSYTDQMVVYDKNFEKVLAKGAMTDPYGGNGTKIVFDTVSKLIDNPSGAPVNLGGTFLYTQKTTTYGPCYISWKLIHSIPRRMTSGDPRYIVNTPQTAASGVVVCLNRSNSDSQKGSAQCDYGPMYNPHVSNDDTHVLLPVSGEVDYFDELQAGTAWQQGGMDAPIMWVMPRDLGGGCKLDAIDENNAAAFWRHFTPVTGKLGLRKGVKFSWGTDKDSAADFGQLCYKIVGPFATWDFLLSFSVGTQSSDGNNYTVPVVYTSDSGGSTSPSDVVLLDPIQFQYGCVLEGTPVLMKDGSVKPIEQVRKGDEVRGRGSEILRVAGTTIGTDTALIHIVDQRGDSLFVTPDHPIPTNHGVVQARRLQRSDTIYSVRGPTTVRSAVESHRVPAVRVYNLTLESPDETRLRKPDEAVFYAGGILVGDNNMQRLLGVEALSDGAPAHAEALSHTPH